MAALDAIEGLEGVAIIGGIAVVAYLAYKLLSSFAASQTGQATGSLASGLIQVPATALDTLVGPNGEAGVPGTNSNLFYTGVNNLFTTGSIYGDQGSTGTPSPTPAPSVPTWTPDNLYSTLGRYSSFIYE